MCQFWRICHSLNDNKTSVAAFDGGINSFDTESNIQFSSMLGQGSGIEE